MKKATILLALSGLIAHQAMASTKCFIAKEEGKIVISEGECAKRSAPCSTFKIPLSLIGFNEKMLVDESHPQWSYEDEYASTREVCKQPQTPASWIQNSCIWYSQVITRKLGMRKLRDYVSEFDYGNEDVSGDAGKNNGLSHAWLTSSLTISPEEQVVFLEKLAASTLPVSLNAQEQSRKLIFLEELPHSWKLFGKTGSGSVLLRDGSQSADLQTGWFVGWLQKGHRKIVFAHYIEDDTKEETSGGLRAKEIAKEKLNAIISKEYS